AIVLRHPDDRAAHELAARPFAACGAGPGTSIVNAGSGCLAHPSQALLDAATLAAAGCRWEGLRVVLIGDIRHSRVARSDIALFERLGVAEIRIAGPAELMPGAGELPAALRFDDLDAALAGADVVVCLRIQRERIAVTAYPDGESYHRRWGLTGERFDRLGESVRVLHPGPVNRGVEIAPEIVDSPRSLILEQVRTGVHLRTAVFEWLIHGP
ncbi:MAG: aspartate carbamoyltransferase catalytic subunit, partial [Wenzhouxiangellaceae bacterium]|nr:aspartate carbamoyltransferase catalytic subunit [Wenzhouxiangellaceae bacterium]